MLSEIKTRLAIRTLAALVLAAAVLPAEAQNTVYVSSEAPTDPGVGTFFEPWQVAEHGSAGYSLALDVPGVLKREAVDAVHKMDRPGNWLFSVGVVSDLGGALPKAAERRDLVKFDGATFSLFLRGDGLATPVPGNVGIDAVFLDGGDSGDVILSFDLPIELPAGSGQFREPADLLRFRRTSSTPSGWAFASMFFDASTAGAGLPSRLNVIGADDVSGVTLLVLDTAAELSPSAGPPVFERGQVIRWDGNAFDVQRSLPSWPGDRQVNALSCQANPGEVVTMLADKSQVTAGDLTLLWSASCSSGTEDYAIYEGTLGNFYSHTMKDCSDDGGDKMEEVGPAAASSYYLIVPYNSDDEGSYGTSQVSGTVAQRPQPVIVADRCVASRRVTACP